MLAQLAGSNGATISRHEPILIDGLFSTYEDSPATVELVDLETGRVVSWSARERTEVVRALGTRAGRPDSPVSGRGRPGSPP